MIYAFEEIGPDLARPPLAARRALLGSGVSVPVETWQMLSLSARQAIAQEGLKEAVSEYVVKNAVSAVLKRVRFMSPVKDPPRDDIPKSVVEAMRALRSLTVAEWHSLTPLDRYTLVAVASNSRLLYRAVEEMTAGPASSLSPVKLQPWVGPVAHAEVQMGRGVLGELAAGVVQGGKAFVLARAAGIRAARAAHDTLDGYAEKWAGAVELDSRIDAEIGGCVWQAHVSTIDGEFFAAAAMLAAATAAVALRDAIAAKDPTSTVGNVALRAEAWAVGSGGFGDEATIAMGGRAYVPPPSISAPLMSVPPPPVVKTEIQIVSRGVPGWVALLLVFSTLLAFAVAGLTIQQHGGFRSLYH